jgi:hypothetical protein
VIAVDFSFTPNARTNETNFSWIVCSLCRSRRKIAAQAIHACAAILSVTRAIVTDFGR